MAGQSALQQYLFQYQALNRWRCRSASFCESWTSLVRSPTDPQHPQVKLEHIFRQSEDSTIVTLASQIRKGQLPPDFTEKKPDRSYFEAPSELIAPMIEKITSAALRNGIPARDIQVLAPMYRGSAGIDQINSLMQELLNPLETGALFFQALDCQYRNGDKVIHLVNDAESNVFNGDIGYITDLLPAKYTESKQDELTIQFDGNELVYPAMNGTRFAWLMP